MPFNFTTIQYPAFVTVFGPSRRYISSHNRAEYDEHFACDLCEDAQAVSRLLVGYPGRLDDLKVYVVPQPQTVLRLHASGHHSVVYEPETPEETDDQ